MDIFTDLESRKALGSMMARMLEERVPGATVEVIVNDDDSIALRTDDEHEAAVAAAYEQLGREAEERLGRPVRR